MRSFWILAAMLVVVLPPGPARAGSVSGGCDVTGNRWTIDETWTNGGSTLELKLMGSGTPSSDLLAILQNFITTLPASGWTPVSVTTTTPNAPTTTAGTDPTSTTTNTDGATTDTSTSLPSGTSGSTTTTGNDSSTVTTTNTNTSAPSADPPIAPVPEPSGVVLALSGVGLAALTIRRRVQRA